MQCWRVRDIGNQMGMNAPENCRDGETICPLHKSGFLFSSLDLSASSSTSHNIPCSPTGHAVEIHYELRTRHKKKSIPLSPWPILPCFYNLDEVFET